MAAIIVHGTLGNNWVNTWELQHDDSKMRSLTEDLIYKCGEFWLHVSGTSLQPYKSVDDYLSHLAFIQTKGECFQCGKGSSSPLLLGTWEGKYVDINFKEIHEMVRNSTN